MRVVAYVIYVSGAMMAKSPLNSAVLDSGFDRDTFILNTMIMLVGASLRAWQLSESRARVSIPVPRLSQCLRIVPQETI